MMVSLLPAGLLALTLICVFVLQSRSVAAKLVSELALLVMIGGCLVWRGTSPLPTEIDLAHGADAAWLRALAAIWWLIGARMVATLTVLALGRDARSRQARLFSDLLAGAIYVTTALIILSAVLDLPVKGLLATSGVIAIVLGLALQNTLADVFSGIAVGIEQPFHVGDRITVADYEGVVVQMNWRSIRVQTDGDDIATIPNSIVARSQIINRSVPSARRAASIDIPTLSAAPLDQVMDLARHAILLSPAILADPEPSVVVRHLGTRMTTLGVNYHVASTLALTPARTQLLRQVRRLYQHAGIQDGKGVASPAGLLASIVLFETLTSAQIDELAAQLVRHRFDVGETLFEQGSVGRSLYIIHAGVFEIARQDEATGRQVYGRIGPGEYLGEISMMSGDPRPVTVIALTAGDAWELPLGALETLLKEDKGLSSALERSVQRGLALLDRDDAARHCHPLDPSGSLLGRIRGFLRLSAHG